MRLNFKRGFSDDPAVEIVQKLAGWVACLENQNDPRVEIAIEFMRSALFDAVLVVSRRRTDAMSPTAEADWVQRRVDELVTGAKDLVAKAKSHSA